MNTKTKRTDIANLASSAKSADDYQKLLSRIQADLDEAEDTLSGLEARRQDIVLNGDDVDAYHRDLLTAGEKVKTLTAAVDRVAEQYETALAKEARANLETQAAAVRDKTVPAYQDALRRFEAAMGEVLKTCDELALHREQIDGLNELVDRKSRSDLRISVSRVRADVVNELAGTGQGFQLHAIERMDGETDDAFELRRGNAEALAARKVQLADPIREMGEKAVIAIQANAFEMGPHERFRNHRVINAQRFLGPYGDSVLKIQNADPTLADPHHRVSHPDIRDQLPDGRMGMGTPSSNA